MPLGDILALRGFLLESERIKEVVAALCAALKHPEAQVRFNAAIALDHMGDQSCTNAASVFKAGNSERSILEL